MAWDSETAQVGSNSGDPAYNRDAALVQWRDLALQLEALKAAEINLRNLIIKHEFEGAEIGTNYVELGAGWRLKGLIKESHNLDKDIDKVDAALATIAASGPKGAFIAERLVKWEPKLSVKEYELLDEEVRILLSPLVTIKPVQGSIELVPPKFVKDQ